MAKTNENLYNSTSQDWETHPDIIQAVLTALGRGKFDVDVCCTKENVPALGHYTNTWGDDNPFLNTSYPWPSKFWVFWLNPPFNECQKWLAAANKAQRERDDVTVALVPVRTETKYWHELVMADNTLIYFIQGKWAFYLDGQPAVMKDGKEGKAPCALALVVFGTHEQHRSFIKGWEKQNLVKATCMARIG